MLGKSNDAQKGYVATRRYEFIRRKIANKYSGKSINSKKMKRLRRLQLGIWAERNHLGEDRGEVVEERAMFMRTRGAQFDCRGGVELTPAGEVPAPTATAGTFSASAC